MMVRLLKSIGERQTSKIQSQKQNQPYALKLKQPEMARVGTVLAFLHAGLQLDMSIQTMKKDVLKMT